MRVQVVALASRRSTRKPLCPESVKVQDRSTRDGEMLDTPSWRASSSSTIVHVPDASAIDAPVGEWSVMENTSSLSSTVSLRIHTFIVFVVSPGEKTTPDEPSGKKSEKRVAVPEARLYCACTYCPLGSERVTVKAAPRFGFDPSTTEMSSMESDGVGSSSVIATVAIVSKILAFDGLEKETEKYSAGSSRASPMTSTGIVFEVSPG